jgi:colanic acid/amylovoran biosynthesis glycosyltransferase
MSEKTGIKLAYLVSRYPAVSHTFIKREISHLRSRGFDIHVASINEPDPPFEKQTLDEKEETANTFYVKRVGFWKALTDAFHTLISTPWKFFQGFFYALYLGGVDLKTLVFHLFYLSEAIIVGRWMEEEKISHIHVHFANPASSVALLLTKLFPVTYSITVHGPDEFYDVTLHRLKEKIEGAHFICCISYYTQSQLMKIVSPEHWAKFVIAHLGVDPLLYIPKTPQQNPSPLEILCVGRLTQTKGQLILIAAISILAMQGLNIHLCCVGDGPNKKYLVDDVSKRKMNHLVEFTGSLNQSQVLEVYKKADIFVLPSFAEGISVSLMEAMSMEIPCIATFVNGIPELIRHKVDGLLVAPSDVQDIVDAISYLAKDFDMRQKLGQAGRKRIMEKFQLEPNTDILGEIFHKHLA